MRSSVIVRARAHGKAIERDAAGSCDCDYAGSLPVVATIILVVFVFVAVTDTAEVVTFTLPSLVEEVVVVVVVVRTATCRAKSL